MIIPKDFSLKADFLLYLHWDPSPGMFSWNLPFLGRPVLWYGFFFALGFLLGYFLFVTLLKKEASLEIRKSARVIADQLSIYVLLGVVIGARLFDVIFYENLGTIFYDPLSVFRFWEGGLSSHGGVMGVLMAVWIYQRRHRYFTLLHLIDLLAIVTGVIAACIRVGNFFNQEILGTPTTLHWGVIFGHPADQSFPIPRHPVQLYEAVYYLLLFGVMWSLKDRLKNWGEGKLCGFFLTAVFVFRFFIEWCKEEQSFWFQSRLLTMGQWLSIPFIILGIILFFRRDYIKSNR